MNTIFSILFGAVLIGFMGCGLMLHSSACGMHVWAVDRLSDPAVKAEWQGLFYRYCKKVARLSEWID